MNEVHIDKNNLVSLVFPVVLLTVFVVSYWPAFQKLLIRWSSVDTNYCYLIVPLFFYLCWERRNIFRFRAFSWSPWGLLPILLSICLIFAGELGSVETFLYMGLWGCVFGLAVTLYGRRTRFLVFPFIVLLFMVPMPPFVNQLLTFNLKMVASKLSAEMLRAFGISVLLEGNILGIGATRLQVADACSGLRSLMSMIPMSLLIGYFFVKGWWRRMILLLMVVPLSIVANAFRIWVTATLTIKGHHELAQSFFHDFSGLLVFMIAVGGLVATALLLKKIGRGPIEASKTDPGARSIGPVLPLALVFILCILFVGSGWALKLVPSAHTCPQRTSFESFPMEIGEWKGKRRYLSEKILNSLWADDYVNATYYKEGFPNLISLLIPFYEYQGTRHTAHTPQTCLLGSGWTLFNSDERMVKVNPCREIKIMTMILEKGDTKLLGSYFFLQRGRVVTSPWLNKFYLMWDAFTRRRTDGALVRVEMTIVPGQSIEDAYVMLENFVSCLWANLAQYVPN
jgi:exosortase D (VPLPA-CTERM-specific)